MDKRVYLLTIVSFVVGMVELIIGGILVLIAEDLNVSVGQAGQLITVFSLIFAIGAPVLLIMTAKFERKSLMITSLVVFLVGNIIAAISPTYSILFISRIISAASASLLIILCLTIAANIVAPSHRGRAIGIVAMGVSGSLVLGVPFGLLLGSTFGWRAPFILISFLTILSIVGVYFLMEKVAPKPAVPLRKQLATLRNRKILFAHISTFLYITGHAVLYAYLTPFVQVTMNLHDAWISAVYFAFGIAAVSGGGIGGAVSDRFGPKPTIFTALLLFAASVFLIPVTTSVMPLFFIILCIWGMMSWAISPAMQSYLIESSPETSDIQQSLSNSSLHFGIAFGSMIGGIIVEQTSIVHTATVGGFFILISIATVIISMASFRFRNKGIYAN